MARKTHQFSQTKTAEIPRSSFDLSHGLKTTFNAGYLVPILSLEVLPGDTINLRASLFGRMATPLKPVMDNLFLESFYFFTPWRQVWPNFVKMMGEQDAPGDSIDYTVPRLSGSAGVTEGSIYDYMGLPIGTIPNDVRISVLPFRAYNKIYNYWFRDQNLMEPVIENTGDTDEAGTSYEILRRRKRRDYITAGLPFPQKGPEVSVGLVGNARIEIDQPASGNLAVYSTNEGELRHLDSSTTAVTVDTQIGQVTQQLYANLNDVSGISINDLRESFQIQKLLERDARGGTRYPEILQSHFRVNDPSLLVHQRPLFLGGGRSMININPVQQTAPSVTDGSGGGTQFAETPQGNLAAYGTVSGSGHGFTASFTEHGHILGLVNVRADLTYQQGIERYWDRSTRFDFYWPALSHLGEMAVKNREVYVSNNATIDDDTFSYMPRYDEYRFKQSQITGLFRSDASASLDVWHLAQDFAQLPSLNQAFIEDNPPIDRVVAVPSEPDFLLDVWFKIKAARPLPLYATPGLIDHF